MLRSRHFLLVSVLLLLGCPGSRNSLPAGADAAREQPDIGTNAGPRSHRAVGGSVSNAERPPNRFDALKKPPGVPDDYVFTHNGFMHPSCVITVRSDGTMVDGNGRVRGSGGVERGTIPSCPFARYGLDGHLITSSGREFSAKPARSVPERDAGS